MKITTSQVRRLLKDEYGFIDFSVRIINKETDLVYLVKNSNEQKFIFKVSLFKEVDEKTLQGQIKFIEVLREKGIGTAGIIPTQTGEKYLILNKRKNIFAIMFEFIEGKQLNLKNKNDVVRFAKWVAKLNQISLQEIPAQKTHSCAIEFLEEINPMMDKMVSKKSWLKPLNDLRLEILKKYKEYLPELRIAFMNNDLQPENIKVTKNEEWALIDFNADWEEYLVDSLSLNIGNFFARSGKLEWARIFWKEYSQVLKLNDQEKDILGDLFFLYSFLNIDDFKSLKNEREVSQWIEEKGVWRNLFKI